jgi:hypothetical protein
MLPAVLPLTFTLAEVLPPPSDCVNNRKQSGLGFRMWSDDNNDKYPWRIPASNGGTYTVNQAWMHYAVISHLVPNPKVFRCPSDTDKVVAENYEFSIFSGAASFLKANKPIIYCELWDNFQRQQVLDLIKSFGYKIFVFRKNNFVEYDPSVYKKKYFFFIPDR